MWRRFVWWSSKRPTVLPWAFVLSGLLLLSGSGARSTISGLFVRLVYAPFLAVHYRIAAGAEVFAENHDLKARLAVLEVDNQRLREAAIENGRLRRLLDFTPGWRGRSIATEVVGPLAPGSGILWIGAGSRRFIQAEWPVVSEDGLLGRVAEVSPDLSRVRTIWDRLLRVAAYDQRSRVTGIVEWESGANLRLNYVMRSADVRPGDTVISSGWGGVFPKGLIIGSVAKVDTLMLGDFLNVSVKPAVRPDRLEEVFVIQPVPNDTLDSEDQGAP
ncbi:MAG: rod shape-determining protein MreC [candidate division Zixibacteria bacterium]|nr:rod shape-determining protein MreC [candidate division Zixibacteria bacterium]